MITERHKIENMIKQTICFLVFLIFSPQLFGTTYYYSNNLEVQFHSDAPQEIIKASSTDMRGLIDVEKKTFVFKVVIRTFNGFNSALQKEHFNDKFLESERYPEAVFSGKIIEDIDYNISGTYTIRAKGRISIHGVGQERIIKTKLSVKEGQIIFEFTVNENGEVKNIKVVRDLGTNSAVELIRVLRKAPKWQPATRGGKPVSINLKMPLTFK